jgi:bacterioferritin (cytochrome b1)
VSSHRLVWLPGRSLEKIAINETIHAEATAERIVHLGGEPTTEPENVILDRSVRAMLENNRERERGVIQLYRQIINAAADDCDHATSRLFQRILADAERHYRVVSALLTED